jgi:UDP-N-acetylmuramyl pentapeptide phosphotransferase/UDP-N-acetylglucosamine-1-phosphate transferase
MICSLIISVLVVSFLGTYFYRKLAISRAIIDVPNERSSHTVPTPRGGGIAIVFSFYIGLIILYFLKQIDQELFFALLSGIPLIIISIIDDLKDVSPKLRLFIQFISSVLVIFFIGGIQIIDLGFLTIRSPYLLVPTTLVGILWFINLFNFLDGIDGYASMEAIFISVTMFLFIGNMEAVLLVFSVLGFLFWNWPKAKIFMGDVGSTALGFVLIVMGIYYNNTLQFNFIYWLIVSSLFWFDASITLFRRWRNKENLSKAHKKHGYQRIVQGGFTHQKTLLFSILFNSFFVVLIFVNLNLKFNLLIGLTICIFLNIIITKLIDKVKPFNN